jgi:lysozyme
VKRGETLFAIAKQLGTDVATLKQLNNLTSNTILVGQQLKTPGSAPAAPAPAAPAPAAPAPAAPSGSSVEHVVQSGEYLSTLAAKYGVTVNAIVQANNLPNANVVRPGQKLIIPTAGAVVTPATPAAGQTTSGKQHVVARGETLQSIALKYGITVKALSDANGIQNANLIYVGQKLVIP